MRVFNQSLTLVVRFSSDSKDKKPYKCTKIKTTILATTSRLGTQASERDGIVAV